MKQIICRGFKLKIPILLVLVIFWGCAGPQNTGEKRRVYQIIGPQIPVEPLQLSPLRGSSEMKEYQFSPSPQSSPPMGERRKPLLPFGEKAGMRGSRFDTKVPSKWTLNQLEARAGSKEMASRFFDKALGYEGSKFQVISFAGLIDLFDPEGLSDAVLLNCFDDYQGILSIADIRRFDIQLATRIKVGPEYKKPDWLNPLLVIVPDNKKAPFQERYLTANIWELQFTRLKEYYAPLRENGGASSPAGFSSFKDNCLFCHSLMGIGGNKGISLLDSYDFSQTDDKNRFRQDFAAFHHKDNADKQNVEQFVSESQLESILDFLRRVNDFALSSANQ
jgi:hypothetical protein